MKKRRPPAGRPKPCLRRVVDDHPATPWALLAERELKDPLGFKWMETYVPPRLAGTTTRRPTQEQESESGQATGNAQAMIRQLGGL